ncbi:MAG: efflux RND transporter periplasmic adaptor subunit [Pseudomonadota bacterium]|nr:efflux RND transporter periplasmic adaptor subunit [Pseudomonadota bacterium]
MIRNPIKPIYILVLAAALALSACGSSEPEADGHAEEHEHGATESQDEAVKGPHGGRLLEDGDFALEVTIFERGIPPEFRLYATANGKPVSAKDVQASIKLSRINGQAGGKTDEHVFIAHDDYLVSPAEVYEPHSFAVTVQASHAGKQHGWTYDSPEGRVSIDADMANAQGLVTAAVGGGAISESLSLYGSIQANGERVRAVTARYPGIVKSVAVKLGDTVQAGDVLATVESNESLQVYAVTAPLAGTITQRNTNPGQATDAAPLFEVADFSSVWAELSVFPRDRARLKLGQTAQLSASDGDAQGTSSVSFVSATGTGNQALLARVVLDNAEGQWTPGQFVNARVAVNETPVKLRVPLAALQKYRDWDVVFVADGEAYQAQPLELGRRDAEYAEVLSGIASGAQIVVANSYLVKADIEKSGASHDH